GPESDLVWGNCSGNWTGRPGFGYSTCQGATWEPSWWPSALPALGGSFLPPVRVLIGRQLEFVPFEGSPPMEGGRPAGTGFVALFWRLWWDPGLRPGQGLEIPLELLVEPEPEDAEEAQVVQPASGEEDRDQVHGAQEVEGGQDHQELGAGRHLGMGHVPEQPAEEAAGRDLALPGPIPRPFEPASIESPLKTPPRRLPFLVLGPLCPLLLRHRGAAVGAGPGQDHLLLTLRTPHRYGTLSASARLLV